jgi:hypothetical protein
VGTDTCTSKNLLLEGLRQAVQVRGKWTMSTGGP